MKVLLTSDIDFPVSRSLKQAGIQRVVYALAKELQRLGVEVTVCSTGDSDELGGALFATVERALHSPPPVPSMSIDFSSGVSDLSSEIILERPYITEAHQRHYHLSLQRALSEGVDIVHDHGGGLLLSDV